MKHFFVLAAVLTVIASCSSGPPVIPAKTVSQQADAQLRKQNPKVVAGTMKCPELVGEVGHKIRCVRSAHVSIWDMTLNGTVRVTKVEGDRVDFAIKMDDDLASFAADRETNESIVADGFGIDKKGISCPKPISGKVGSIGYCTGTDTDGTKHKIKLTVTSSSLDEGDVHYNMRVVD